MPKSLKKFYTIFVAKSPAELRELKQCARTKFMLRQKPLPPALSKNRGFKITKCLT
jgi:hypothetical protein